MKNLALAVAAAAALSIPVLAEAPRVALKLVAEGLTQPVSYAPLPDGLALVVEQTGQIRLIDEHGKLADAPVAVLTNRLSALNHGAFDERGLLCVAPHPGFASNRRLFATYTAPRRASAPADFDCTLRLVEFVVPVGEPMQVDLASERVLLEVDKPFANHNGGRLAFGPDGLLYMSVGDGGAANDRGKRPETGNGQDLSTHLGKVLRLDVSAPGKYRIPRDNPFADGKVARPEIWAYGLRNVWALTFDKRGQRELFAADVGQNLFEEVDIITKGANYGWSLREGFQGFDAKAPNTPPADAPRTGARGEPLVDPVFEYKHTGGKKDPEAVGISITGGFVYRGKALPQLEGRYVFGDWSRNWALPQGTLLAATRPADGKGRWTFEPLTVTAPSPLGAYITAFGQDERGELYVLTNGANSLVAGKGKVWKIVPAE